MVELSRGWGADGFRDLSSPIQYFLHIDRPIQGIRNFCEWRRIYTPLRRFPVLVSGDGRFVDTSESKNQNVLSILWLFLTYLEVTVSRAKTA